MDGKRLRYLAQQVELGGAEVVLSHVQDWSKRTQDSGLGTQGAPSNISALVPAEVPVVSESRVPSPESSASESRVLSPKSSRPKWKRGAPPIPGPGLTVAPPGLGLLDDPAGGLESLAAVEAAIAGCRRCGLCEGRTNTVPGEGNPGARLLLVGEGPGATEDETGRPFVGRAGALLNDILAAIDLPRQTVYITNIVKCRPPQNRKPLPDEVAACLPYLHRQLALIRPAVILALGSTAAESLLGARKSLGELRGKVHTYGGIPLVVTYHPAALLRNPHWKKPTWDDVRIARQLLDR